MKAESIMTKKVVMFKDSLTLQEAALQLIIERISGAPVINESEEVVGMITERDLIVSADFVGDKKMKEIQVNEVMTKNIISFSKETSIDEIARTLIHHNIKRVPVLENGKCIGIVSRREILKYLVNR